MSDDMRAQAQAIVDEYCGIEPKGLVDEIERKLRAAGKAERKRIADRLDACFEPTSPAISIGNELAVVACAIIREARRP
jgi:hypothetical protein